jgi:macrolide transport system ATP-binding/permease protein
MIEIRDLHKTYRLGEVDVHALRGVSLRIEAGEFVAIIGPSGSGKSTLMHLLGLLDTPDRGTFLFDGHEVSRLTDSDRAALRARAIGFVFQQFNLLPRATARENVALPLIYRAEAPVLAPEALLRQVGLGDRLEHAPRELSGGQQQRVAIARALINGPKVVMADEPTGNLDSGSSADILRLLHDLNARGLTVILVTHDPEIAAQARRVITIRDGRVVDDVKRATGAPAVTPPQAEGSVRVRSRWQRAGGELVSLLRQAMRSLAANKVRTFLSMLGVLIGVMAVIAVMALGGGAKKAVEDRISTMGANLLILWPGHMSNRGVAMGVGEVSRLTLEDAEALSEELPMLSAVAPTVNGNAQLTYGGVNWRSSVLGTTPPYAVARDTQPGMGRFISEDDVRSRALVAVIGLTVARELFGQENPVGKTIRMNRVSFEVIGVLPEKSAGFRSDPNDQVIIPITTAMRRLLGNKYVGSIELQVREAGMLADAETQVRALMHRRHRVPEQEEDAYMIRNMADLQKALSATGQTMSVLLTSIGAISLLVGGIGIMNIMLVSVTERTREIGLRKAVGARRGDILVQFLVEALAVSALGGLLGIGLGIAVSLAMTKLAGWTVILSPLSIGVAFGFAVLVGVVFGLWPARKASLLDPITALRYE